MIARESFENSLPRLASAAPFLCLIEDHLLCPDTRLLLHHFEEPLVHARVVGQLRMERRDEEAPVAHEHGLAVVFSEHFHPGADIAHARRADEDATQLLDLSHELEIGLEARHLPPVRIAVDEQIDEPEMLAIEHDHPRARAEHGPLEAPDRLVEPVEPHQPHERRRLPAGDDEPVEPLELLRLAHLDDLRAEPAQHRDVLAKIPLESKDADLHDSILPTECARRGRSAVAGGGGLCPAGADRTAKGSLRSRRASRGTTGSPAPYQPRVSSSSEGSSEAVEIPTIGSPRPAETSASTFGSLKCVVAS